MNRTSHFRHFTLANIAPVRELPTHMVYEPLGPHFLYRHKDLNWSVAKSENGFAILGGIALHIEEDLNLSQLVERLLNASDPLDEIDHWTGNFFCIIGNQDSFQIISDASASNKVYFSDQPELKWVGSDPILMEYWKKREPKEDPIAREFYDSKWFMERSTLIGDQTPFQGIGQVVANHALTFPSMKVERIFPRKPRIPMSMDQASNFILPRMTGLFERVTRDFKVNMALTAGWDSRLLMSASKQKKDDILYYTYRRDNNPDSFPDIAIPLEMSRDLEFPYKVIDERPDLPQDELEVIQKTFSWVSKRRFSHFMTNFQDFDPDNLVLVGTISEVGKNYLENIPVKNGIQAVRALHFVESPYLVSYYDQWLEKNVPLLKSMGYQYMDFMHWEQDITNYAGAGIQYGNHVVNVIPLLNSRKILEAILSVDPVKRDKHTPKFYRFLVRSLWPEILNYPINPFPREKRIRMAKKMGWYSWYKWAENRFRAKPFEG